MTDRIQPSSTNDVEEDWITQSVDAKSEGDAAFKSSDFQSAITNYTNALAYDNPALTHLLYSNRSAAYLALNERGKALKDGKKCTETNPKFSKGFSRVGAAEFALGRFAASASSYEEGLRVELLKPVSEQKGVDSLLESQKNSLQKQTELEERQNVAAAESERVAAANPPTSPPEMAAPEVEEDLMADFFSDITETTTETVVTKISKPTAKYTDQDLSPFDNKSVIDSLLQQNYKWKNLNPFRVFRLGTDANTEDIKLRYKRLSGKTHPDKNLSDKERAELAFDEVKRCYEMLKNEMTRAHAASLVEAGESMGLRNYKNDQKKGDLEQLKEIAVMKVFAEVEQGRRDADRKELDAKKRERQVDDDKMSKMRNDHNKEKSWSKEERMDGRMKGWNDFSKQPSNKKQRKM